MGAKVKYSDSVSRPLPEKAENILTEILDTVGLKSALVTSTVRTPEEQAHAMYENLAGAGQGKGVDAQRKLYKGPGNLVIDVYVNLLSIGQTPEWIQTEMAREITKVGPQNVSHHCVGDAAKLSVFDVAPSSIPEDQRDDFCAAVSLNASIDKFLKPPEDPAYHIEIVL
jgi:hypothetical protein